MTRIHDLERAIHPSRKARTAKPAATAASITSQRTPTSAVPSISFAASFDEGGPVVIRHRAPATRTQAMSSAPRTTAWRDVGAVSQSGYAEPLEEYEEDAPPPTETVAAEPQQEDSPAARLVLSEEPAAEAQESRAFAQEIERLLAQAKGGPADAPRADAPAPAPAPAARVGRGGQELPPDHPHRIFDQMSFANAFDGGTVDLDGVERDALPRPRRQPRIESFAAAGGLEAVDVAEDLALIRAQEATKHHDIASDAVVTADIEARIAPIADAYFAETGRNILITSGKRTALAQARAMYDKLQAGGDFSIYKNKTAAAEIKKAYDDAKASGAAEADVIAAMCKVLEAQVAAGTYISRHLFAGAVDVRKKDMSAAEKKAFERAVAAQQNVTLLDEGEPPHFHLEFR